MHLLEVLREECGVVSAKNGCAPEGACGCCLVVIDGRPALSCLRKPEQMDGHDIVTLEGMPEETRKRIADAFVLEGGVQCGFCIPGIVVRAAALSSAASRTTATPSPRRSTATSAAAPATGESSTPSRPRAKPSKTAGTLRVPSRAATDYFGEEFGLTPQSRTGQGAQRPQQRRRRRPRGAAARRPCSRRSARSRSSTTCAFRACCTAPWC